jgi:hypothetical protein
MISSIITKTMDLVVLSAKEREKVALYREQTFDEVVLNRALLSRFQQENRKIRYGRDDAEKVAALMQSLRSNAFERVNAGDLSVKRIFPERLKRPDAPDASDGKGTRQYLSWISNDVYLSDLLRRFYRKLDLHRHLATGGIGHIDVRYLVFILSVLSGSFKMNR